MTVPDGVLKLLLRLLLLAVAGVLGAALLLPVVLRGGVDAFYGRFRSEEHTSELQSRP